MKKYNYHILSTLSEGFTRLAEIYKTLDKDLSPADIKDLEVSLTMANELIKKFWIDIKNTRVQNKDYIQCKTSLEVLINDFDNNLNIDLKDYKDVIKDYSLVYLYDDAEVKSDVCMFDLDDLKNYASIDLDNCFKILIYDYGYTSFRFKERNKLNDFLIVSLGRYGRRNKLPLDIKILEESEQCNAIVKTKIEKDDKFNIFILNCKGELNPVWRFL